jgi:hypothetical protein
MVACEMPVGGCNARPQRIIDDVDVSYLCRMKVGTDGATFKVVGLEDRTIRENHDWGLFRIRSVDLGDFAPSLQKSISTHGKILAFYS